MRNSVSGGKISIFVGKFSYSAGNNVNSVLVEVNNKAFD